MRCGQTKAGSVLTCHCKLALAVASRLSLSPEQPQPLAETAALVPTPMLKVPHCFLRQLVRVDVKGLSGFESRAACCCARRGRCCQIEEA
jgi:hypothetical protein